MTKTASPSASTRGGTAPRAVGDAAPEVVGRAPGDASSQDAQRLRSRHRLMLVLAGGVVLASAALVVVPEGRVAVVGLEEYPLPHTCAFRMLFGTGCLGCGLTRSFIHLAHGAWRESVAVHRVGWLLAGVVLLQFPYRLAGLTGRNALPLGRRLPRVCGWSIVVLLAVNWMLRLLGI